MALVEWGDVAAPVLGEGSLAVAAVGGRRGRRPAVDHGRGRSTPPGPPGGRRWRPGSGPGGWRPVTLLAIESATDMVGVGADPRRRGVGRAGPRRGAGPRRAAGPGHRGGVRRLGCTVRPTSVGSPSTSGPACSPGCGWGWPRPRPWPRPWPSACSGSAVSTCWPRLRRTARRPARPRPVAAVVDARRGEVFAAAYRFDRPAVRPGEPDRGSTRSIPGTSDSTGPGRSRPRRWRPGCSGLAAEAGRVTVVGDGAVRYRRAPGGPRRPRSRPGRPSWPPPPAGPGPTWPSPACPAGPPPRPRRTWCPTTGGRPTPGSTGSSGPPDRPGRASRTGRRAAAT